MYMKRIFHIGVVAQPRNSSPNHINNLYGPLHLKHLLVPLLAFPSQFPGYGHEPVWDPGATGALANHQYSCE